MEQGGDIYCQAEGKRCWLGSLRVASVHMAHGPQRPEGAQALLEDDEVVQG
jgi:hypothetical protein